MNNINISDIKEIQLKRYSDTKGNLIAIENLKDIPFEIKRVFYVYDANGQTRGKHAHYQTKQVLICVSGECTVVCRDGKQAREITLSNPEHAVLIPEMIWNEITYHSSGSVLLVLSNTPYNTFDYINNWQEYVSLQESKK
tara:strand:+ start:87 stop:506 length:420 start_codon:yes stop_codon:yes gene_type:complete